jgi:tRNA-binding protein
LASIDDLLALDVRAGTVVSARRQRGARTPAYELLIDFGAALGRLASSAPLTGLYEAEDLVGLQVLAVVNLPPERVAGFDSQVRVLAVSDGRGGQVLLIPERPVPDGGKVS